MTTTELRELLARATPGPWKRRDIPWETPKGNKCMEYRVETAWIHGQLRDHAPIIGIGMRYTDDPARSHGVWLSKEDAAIIVAAINALPALLEVAARAKACTYHAGDCPSGYSASDECNCGIKKLHESIAKLEAAK